MASLKKMSKKVLILVNVVLDALIIVLIAMAFKDGSIRGNFLGAAIVCIINLILVDAGVFAKVIEVKD